MRAVRAATLALVAALASTGAVVRASPAAAAPKTLWGCAYKEVCIADGDHLVFAAVGDRRTYPAEADDRADRVINNGSSFDVVLYEHAGDVATTSGWALCVPQGQVVGLAGLSPAVQDQASSHVWVAGGTCKGKVSWLRRPGSTSAASVAPKATATTATTTAGAGAARSAASDLGARMVTAARSQLGVREAGVNKGSRVTEYQKSVRNDPIALGQAWCASFLTWLSIQASDPTVFRSAVVSEWVGAANRGRSGMGFVRQSDVRPGDLVAFKRGRFWEHMGIVSSVRDGVIQVISGNTTAPDKKADGVFDKPLSNWTSKGFAATFIRNDR